jgi:hypothetical protein
VNAFVKIEKGQCLPIRVRQTEALVALLKPFLQQPINVVQKENEGWLFVH